MLSLKLYCIARSPHLSMPVTGLLMLQEQGRLRLTYEIDPLNRHGLPYPQLLELHGDGKCLLFDLADGYGEVELRAWRGLAQRADLLFRRSFSSERVAELPPSLRERIRPLGLQFHTSYPGSFMDAPQNWRDALFQLAFNGRPRSWFTPDRFEHPPRRPDRPRILFYTRLWDPRAIPAMAEELDQLNHVRVCLAAQLKRAYGPSFTGGIQFSPYARKRCKSLIAPISSTWRKAYLAALQKADICIGTTGLHGSIGWKTAEYAASSRAIVCEPLRYELPGGFREGVHYLAFTDADACMERVERLMTHPKEIYEMECANQAYYRAYGRPDRMMANALRQAFPDFEGGAECESV